MPTVPLTNRFHTTTSQVPTVNLGSALANSDRETYSMQDIADTVTSAGGVDGSGTTGMIPKWSDSNTLTDSGIEEVGTGINVTGQMNLAALNTAPASATAAGTAGEIRWAADYVYLCTAASTWVRAALVTWP
tara:strand:+ start:2207 stop:2602 length:396 start_codon:yes stop_codon:yes gene_type:complete